MIHQADDSHEMSNLIFPKKIFFLKIKMLSAAVVISTVYLIQFDWRLPFHL